MFLPGLPPRAAQQVGETADLAESLDRRLSRIILPEDDRPWMKITGRYSGNGLYAWTEQQFDTTDGFVDLPGGRVGTINGLAGATATKLPAREMNDGVISSFPVYVRGERAIESASYGVYYRFPMPATAAAGIQFVQQYVFAFQPSVYYGSSLILSDILTANTTGLHWIAGEVNCQWASPFTAYPQGFLSIDPDASITQYTQRGIEGSAVGFYFNFQVNFLLNVNVAPCKFTFTFSNRLATAGSGYTINTGYSSSTANNLVSLFKLG